MTCRTFVELVTAYLDGALDARANREFLGHLDSCQGCGRYLDQLRQTSAVLRSLMDPPPDPDVVPRHY